MQEAQTFNLYPQFIIYFRINSLPNCRIQVWSKVKVFADNRIYMTEKLEQFLAR